MTPSSEAKTGRPPLGSKGRGRALLYLAVAVLAALSAAVILTRYMDARLAAVRVPTEKVVVAAAELPIATTLRGELLTAVEWPVGSMPDGAVHDPKELEGRVVNAPVARGEPVLLSKVGAGDTGRSALATALAPGMRAMSVRVDDVVGVAGFIHPGDHVDVIVTMSPELGNSPPSSKIILQNVKVLAVGKELESRRRDPQSTVSATVATLMVDSAEAERLALAASKGQILLTLRGAVDTDVVATTGVAPAALLGRGPPPARPEGERAPDHTARRRAVAVRTAPAAPPPRPTRMVEILRGDLYEKRDFHSESTP